MSNFSFNIASDDRLGSNEWMLVSGGSSSSGGYQNGTSDNIIYIGDPPSQWESGDTITIPASQPFIQGPVYPQETYPLGQPAAPLGWPVVPYPDDWEFGKDIKPQEWTEEEVIKFLESLKMVPEKIMRKIRKALEPQKPIDYNNRIDDLILDMGE